MSVLGQCRWWAIRATVRSIASERQHVYHGGFCRRPKHWVTLVPAVQNTGGQKARTEKHFHLESMLRYSSAAHDEGILGNES